MLLRGQGQPRAQTYPTPMTAVQRSGNSAFIIPTSGTSLDVLGCFRSLCLECLSPLAYLSKLIHLSKFK